RATVYILFATLILGAIVLLAQLVGPWVERKVMARQQARRGPVHVGWKGILQIPASIYAVCLC
ncbi:MAG TPA: hypothetical protein ENK99_02885, partial [Campylobacterales bacterium]|nr:hypothetical protein [Campylobacterales bacterium]